MTVARETLPTTFLRQRGVSDENADISVTATTFRDRFDGKDATEESRKENATTLVNEYYDLVTDFYEYGWGQAFHFAPRYMGESFEESIERHEYYLALRAGWNHNHRLIDIGCGVGGPLRNVVRFTGAHVTGINNNAYQISRGKRHDQRYGLNHRTDYIRTDFNTMPIADGTIDGAYAIEATCHAADRVKCFKEILRTLKPGGYFTGYEWVLTRRYDAANEEHRRVKHAIELGNGLPTLTSDLDVKKALEDAGFIVEDFFDVCEKFENGRAQNHTWYEPLQGSYTRVSGWKSTPVGRFVTRSICQAAETLRLTPKGSVATADILEEAAAGLVRGGELQIFTPCLFFLARKPGNAPAAAAASAQ
jgi:sterol 24-C-methyltransferase